MLRTTMKEPIAPEIKPRKKFDRNFKREAVTLWINSGKSAQVIAAEMGLRDKQLYQWRKALGPVPGVKLSITELEAQNLALRRDNDLLRQQRDILKKNIGHSLRTSSERYVRIDAMKNEHSIRWLCALLQVSSSGYYDWLERQTCPGPRAQENVQLAAQILRIHHASRKTYGSPRIQFELSQNGHVHGRNRIARLMRQQKLSGRAKGRFRVRTTDSNHDQPIAPNRLAELPAPTASNQIWLGDITYIRTGEGWLYLAGVMDRYSRRIVGWAMDEKIDTELVLTAWQMAHTQRQPAPKLVFHSDRGSQYASAEFRQALSASQTQTSMSRRGNCYDNAAMESFWSTLKMELVYRQTFATRQQARQAIFDYIEVFYNRQRRHSALGYVSPNAFENQTN